MIKDPIEKVLPTGGWLHEYVHFGSGLEVCARFRFFSACCILGAAINNRVFIHRGDPELLPKIFPNPWVLLLAPPGRGHKTSTINMAVNCMSQAYPEVRILADKITPESLVKALSEPSEREVIRIGPRDATGLIKAPELSVFFGKQQYNQGLVSLITDLYDFREEWSSETIMRGRNVLKNICISIIGGSTPDWLQTMLPQDAFTGGFMSRFIIVEMPPTYYRRVAEPARPNGTSWVKLVDDLADFREYNGEMGWTDRGRKYYRDYYEGLTPTGEVQRDAYQEREVEQVIKIAMLLALCEDSMSVSDAHMDVARRIFNALMPETVPRIDRLTTHPRMKTVQDILDLLRRKPMTRKELLQKLYKGLAHGEQQFTEAIRVLCMSGDVEMDATGKGTATNPVFKLRTTKGGDEQ